MPPVKHARLSASSAHRWLECPPSVAATEHLPDETSIFAEEGSAAHEAAEYKVRWYLGERDMKPPSTGQFDADEIDRHTDTYAFYAADKIEEIRKSCPDAIVLVEQRLDFSNYVEDGFGTGDLVNKTKQTYQFKGITVTDAIKELCRDLSINIVTIPELSVIVNKIYFDKNISEIISDLLSLCDGEYNYDFTPDGLRIYIIGDLIAEPVFKIAPDLAEGKSVEYMGGMSHSTSIESLKNSVKVVSEKDKVYTELLVLQDRDSIDKNGFLQEIVKIDTEKENAETTARQYLASNNRETEKYSFEILENMTGYTRAGEVMDVAGVRYVIESTDHSIRDGFHYVKMEVRKIV